MIRWIATIWIACLALAEGYARNGRALLIGVSDYDRKATAWEAIHGTNDVAIVGHALKMQGFTHISVLRNEEATFGAICKAWEMLIRQSMAGDVVYVHLSGHGQPVQDYDGDEPDGWDEAFVPYDAPKHYRRGVYEGQRHLTDDVIHRYVERLRSKVGGEGMVYVSIDACHAGDSYRGDDDVVADSTEISMTDYDMCDVSLPDSILPLPSDVARGSAEGFSRDGRIYSVSDVRLKDLVTVKADGRKARLVMMESCLSTQRSYELKLPIPGKPFYCGPLSFVIYKVLTTRQGVLTTDASWVGSVKQMFSNVLPRNNPQKLVIETTEDYLFR